MDSLAIILGHWGTPDPTFGTKGLVIIKIHLGFFGLKNKRQCTSSGVRNLSFPNNLIIPEGKKHYNYTYLH